MLNQIRAIGDRVSRQSFATIHQGVRVLCPICTWRGRRFMATGRCPQCNSLARTRLLPFALQRWGVTLDGALLHIGPNIDEIAYVVSRFTPSPYHRLDLLPRATCNLTADMTQMPLADQCTATVLIWHVLEHIPDDRAAIREMYRVLAPGGRVLMSVPIYPAGRETTEEDPSVPPSDRARLYGHPDHVRACGHDYGERFREAGFAVDRLRIDADVDPRETQFFGLRPDHVVWRCTRPTA